MPLTRHNDAPEATTLDLSLFDGRHARALAAMPSHLSREAQR